MKSKTSTWFQTKVAYEKEVENGEIKKITEIYVVEAASFTEAEDAIMEEACHYASGEFDVTGIAKAPFKEVYFSENPRDDKWYKVKVNLLSFDEKTQKEKKASHTYLVQSNSLQNAVKSVDTFMGTGMQDWEFSSIAATQILDVYEKKAFAAKEEADDKPEYEVAETTETENTTEV